MNTRGFYSATVAAFLTLASMTAWAQGQHQEHHPGQSQQMMEGSEQAQARHGGKTAKCPMMAGGMHGGMMHDMGGMDAMGGGMMGGGMMGGGMMDLDVENLTEQQQERLAALHGRQAEQHFKLMLEMRQARERMQALISEQSVDTDAAAEAYDELAQARREMFLSHLQARQEIQEIVGDRQGADATRR